MNIHSFLSLLQFADGLFPAGAYAHSFGLETCVQSGAVRDAAGVEAFLRTYLEGSSAPTDSVAVLCAWRGSEMRDLDGCLSLDETLDAMKPVSELRGASRQMGRQTLRVAAHLSSDHFLKAISEAVESGATPGHHAVAFGVVGDVLGWPPEEIVCAFLYSASAALVGAALRLLSLGQLAGQQILWNVGPLISKLASEVQERDRAAMWSFAPAQEIAAMRHASLEARLFRS
ncbi:MAG: urease accessory protein UreF [Terriglobia bacterium]